MSLVALTARSFLFGIDLFVKISKMGIVGICRMGLRTRWRRATTDK